MEGAEKTAAGTASTKVLHRGLTYCRYTVAYCVTASQLGALDDIFGVDVGTLGGDVEVAHVETTEAAAVGSGPEAGVVC